MEVSLRVISGHHVCCETSWQRDQPNVSLRCVFVRKQWQRCVKASNQRSSFQPNNGRADSIGLKEFNGGTDLCVSYSRLALPVGVAHMKPLRIPVHNFSTS